MKRVLLPFVLFALAAAAVADGAIEVSVVQSTFVGRPFVGTVGSIRLCTLEAPNPFGELACYADGGVRLSETTENSIAGFLVGASVGQRGSALRFGAGYIYPDSSLTVYTRAVLMRW